jgi:hypothetical protein
MRTRYLVLGLAVALVIVTTVLVITTRSSQTAAGGSDLTVTNTVVVPGESSSAASTPGSSEDSSSAASSDSSTADSSTSESAATSTSSNGEPVVNNRPVPSNVPMTKLQPGQKPPQFIIFSFDGAGSHERWHTFMDAAAKTNSRVTGFLSGIYLIGDSGKDAGVYTGPGHATGKASIGYGGPESEIITEVQDLNEAYSKGHEIGTHYNGHFCDDNPPGGNQWTTADWNVELDQFFTFMRDWKTLNGYTDAPDLTVPTTEVKGGRTPCLTGDFDQLAPAWKAHGLTYDSSIPAPYTGLGWPEKKDGIWEFYMPTVYSPGFQDTVMAMDYNFWVQFNGAADQPETAPQLRGIVKGTYDYMFDQAFNGNRAPVLVANHFNKWNGDSFNPAALDFMNEKCGQPDVICTTYQDVIAWMELQDPAVLQSLIDQAPVASGPSS